MMDEREIPHPAGGMMALVERAPHPLLSMAALTVEHLKVRVYLLPLSNK